MEEGGNCRCGRFIEVVGGRIWKEKEEWSSLSESTTDIYLSIVTPIRHYTITPFTLKDVGLEIYKRGKNFLSEMNQDISNHPKTGYDGGDRWEKV